MNGMCGIDPDRGPLARSIQPTIKPSPLGWAKQSRAVGPLMPPHRTSFFFYILYSEFYILHSASSFLIPIQSSPEAYV